MGDVQLVCPLCCDKSFDSKQSLLDHLTQISNNLFCPLCTTKCSSLEGLTEHLNHYDCQNVQNDTVQNIVIYEQSINVDNVDTSDNTKKELTEVTELNATDSETQVQLITDQQYECQDDTGEVSKMYAELIGKQLSKPMLQTQQLKLIKEDGESRYMIVTETECEFGEDNAIVTKQNNDGTISLTTVKDIKLESETLIAPDSDSGNSQAELYSCNACKVSFTSIVDHIRNFHNDQDVLVEEVPATQQMDNVIVEYDPLEEEESPTSDKQIPRRVITDTGAIVEEPVVFKGDDTEIQQDTIEAIIKHPKLVLDKQGRAYTRRYVQIDKVAEGGTSKVSPVTSEIAYHKVVTKEVQTKTGFTVKMYHCTLCNVGVTSLNEFLKQPCKVLKHACLRCPAMFDNSKSLCAHMKAHKLKTDGPEAPVTYECEVCNTIFPTNKSLKLHKRMHDPVKIRPIELPVENNDGRAVTADLYRCQICDKLIPFDYRSIHENSHNIDEKLHCSICNKKFSSIAYLEMHMNVHNLDKVTVNNQDKSLPYKCLYCNRRFARPHEKVKHERIHTGEKPHSCEICGKSFRVSYCLTLHMRTHTGARPYACPHCGKRFKAHSVYNHHLLTHSEVRAYKCPYCPKAFKTSVQLAGHKNSHTKPFSCQHCNRPFASLYAVRVHTETHSRQNNLKFSCALCGASYARAFALKDHVKQLHHKGADTADTADTADSLVDNNSQDEDWMRENGTVSERMQSLNKELQQDMTELEMNTNELIIP